MRDTRLRRSVSEYLADLRERNLSTEYIRVSRNRLRHFCAWMEGEGVTCLSHVTSEVLGAYMATFRGHAASSQQFTWAVIKSFLKFHEHRLGTKFRWAAQGRDRQVRWLTEAEINFLLDQPMSPREALMVNAGLYGMLRKVEVLRLRASDLLIARDSLTLSVWAKNKVRPVPIHPEFRMAIESYLASVDLAPGDRALPISGSRYRQILKGLERRTGIPCQAHTLRRSGLRMLNKRGVPLPTISAIAGHSNPETTMRYIGSPMDDMRGAISLLELKTVHRQT